jgi:hypothetical protein
VKVTFQGDRSSRMISASLVCAWIAIFKKTDPSLYDEKNFRRVLVFDS